MALRLDDLREAVVDQLGLLEEDHMLNDTTLTRAVNVGLRRMARERDWPWLKTSTTINVLAGTQSYPLPVNYVRIVRARIGTDDIEASSLDLILDDLETSGTATQFIEDEGDIVLAPIPNLAGTLKIVYIKPDNKLVDDDDVSLAPEIYEDVIVLYAAIYQATRMANYDLVKTLEDAKERELRNVRKDVIRTSKIPAIKTRDDF